MRILLVEDDALLGDALQAGLREAGFDVDWVRDGALALSALEATPFSAAVLDLGLPRVSGLDVLTQTRARGCRLPILILTARDAVDARVEGLDAGADDYVVKPVALTELSARLRALVRRASGDPAPVMTIGPLSIDLGARTVSLDGAAVTLQAREFTLLAELALNAGRVLSREQLEDRLYSWDREVGSNAVEVHVHNLRRKLAPEIIRTVRGVGYLMPKARRD